MKKKTITVTHTVEVSINEKWTKADLMNYFSAAFAFNPYPAEDPFSFDSDGLDVGRIRTDVEVK